MSTPRMTPLHWHEALDRAHCVTMMLEHMLGEHTLMLGEECPDDVYYAYHAASDALADLYGAIGQHVAEPE